MTTAAQFQTKVTKASTNMDRLDQIVNGDVDTVVETDGGDVPSFAKFLNEFEISDEAVAVAVDARLDTALPPAIEAALETTLPALIADKADAADLVDLDDRVDDVEVDATQALLDAGAAADLATAFGLIANAALPKDGSTAMTGSLTASGLFNNVNPSAPLGFVATPLAKSDLSASLVEGSLSSPITNEGLRNPLMNVERHVAGRINENQSDEINGLHAPTMMIQTIVGTGASNAISGVHSRVVSKTARGMNPASIIADNPSYDAAEQAAWISAYGSTGATNPSGQNFATYLAAAKANYQAFINASTNLLCAFTGMVDLAAPAGQPNRDAWGLNLEMRYDSGLKPQNMGALELDIKTTAGGSAGGLPGVNDNFFGVWISSAPGDGAIGSPGSRPMTVGVLLAQANSDGGYVNGFAILANVLNSGLYIQNDSTVAANYGVQIEDASSGGFHTGLGIAANLTHGIRITNQASSGSGTGLSVKSGAGLTNWLHGIELDADFTNFAAQITNTRNASGAGGLFLKTARANADTAMLSTQVGSDPYFLITGDPTNPIAMRTAGAFRGVTSFTAPSGSGPLTGYTFLIHI